MTKFPGWRHMTGAQRYNAKAEAIWAEARRLERENRAKGLAPNYSLLPPDNAS